MMRCIIVDDEPIAREGLEALIDQTPLLELLGSFNSAEAASIFMNGHVVDLIFLDIKMPGIGGLEFAKHISKNTLIIFSTAFSEYAIDSYEVDAVDFLVKPIEVDRFTKAVNKAISYHSLLEKEEKETISTAGAEYIFVKSERRFFKVNLNDILFIEGLKDYVIIQLEDQRIITRMNLKTIYELLPQNVFIRVSRSYIINTIQIDSFDNNDVFIDKYEISIGNTYRDSFFEEFVNKNESYTQGEA